MTTPQDNTGELTMDDHKAVEDYSFQVPYDGSNNFYNETKAKAFEAGILYERNRAAKEQPAVNSDLLEAAKGILKIRKLLGYRNPVASAIAQLEAAVAEKAGNGWREIAKYGLPERFKMVIVPGGVAYLGRDDEWHSLTAMEFPGRVIQWKVARWMPLPEPDGTT